MILDEIVNEIESFKENDFVWQKNQDKVAENLGNINFIADVDKENIYILMLMTVIHHETGKIRWLTEEESNSYYLNKILPTGYDPLTWVSMIFNTKSMFLKQYSSDLPTIDKSPKENFAICFTQNKDFERKCMGNMQPDDLDFATKKHDLVVTEEYEFYSTYNNLKKALSWQTTHEIGIENFYRKINIPMSRLFVDQKRDIRDDQYSETDERDYIEVPTLGKIGPIPKSIKNIVSGISYDSVYFKDEQRIAFEDTKEISASEQGKEFLFNVLNYVNKNKIDTINQVERMHLINDWKTGETNKCLFRICKTNNQILFELEDRFEGIVHLYKRVQE